MTGKTKIFWTDTERAAIADALIAIERKSPMTTRSAAVNEAQRVLPESRRRKIKFWANVRDQLEPFVSKAQGEGNSRNSAPNAEQREGSAALDTEVQHELWLAQTVDKVAPFFARLLQHSEVQTALKLALGGLHQAQPAEVAQDATVPVTGRIEVVAVRPFKPRMVVAGLLPAQAEEIKKTLGHAADLKFWRGEESKDLLRSLCKNCDVAVGVTSFLSHSAEAVITATAKRYVRHSGGVSKLKGTLADALRHQPA